MPRMPNQVPLRSAESIGQVKVDRERIPNYTEYVNALEWNNLCDELIATAQLAINLAAGGSTGTLQQVYNNGIGPTTIVLDAVREGISIKDAAVPIGSGLFLVQESGGTIMVRFAVADFVVSASGTGIKSNQADNAVQLVALDGNGRNFLPAQNERRSLGLPTWRWAGAHVLQYATKCTIIASAAAPVFDGTKGGLQQVTLTQNMTGFSFINMADGQIITCVFTQGGAGGWILTGTVPANVFLLDGLTKFSLVPDVDRSTCITFRYDSVLSALWEIGRSHELPPPEQRTRTRELTNVNITLTPLADEGIQIFYGTLTGAVNINLTNAYSGARFVIVFRETTGVVTDNAGKTLTLLNNGANIPMGAGNAVFDQNKTLRGRIEAIQDGSNWIISFGGALSYA